jgi:disulfide oxidoreductase YuzD
MMVEGNKRYAEFLVKRREEERQWQEQLRIWDEEKKQKNLQKLRENRLNEMEQLLVTADDWDKAARLRKFLNAVELKIEDIQNKEKQEKLINWIAEQRMKVDWFDPLVYSEDEELGIGPYLFDEIINDKNEK